MTRYFLVANQTLGGPELDEALRKVLAEGRCSFHVIVPATPPRQQLVWTEGEARAVAAERMRRTVDALRSMGAEADGEVSDANPVLAVEDALREHPCDAIILSTFSPTVSRWARRGVPTLLRRFGVPVHHVVTEVRDLLGA